MNALKGSYIALNSRSRPAEDRARHIALHVAVDVHYLTDLVLFLIFFNFLGVFLDAQTSIDLNL